MIKQLLDSVVTKYRDFISVSQTNNLLLLLALPSASANNQSVLAIDKSRYFSLSLPQVFVFNNKTYNMHLLVG